MSEAGRRLWWRRVAATVIGGGAAAGLWFGVIRDAGAEPVPPQHVRVIEIVSPGATAVPPAPPAPSVTVEPSPPVPETRTDANVVPAAVSVPTIATPPTLPGIPVVPASAATPAAMPTGVQPAVPPLPLTELPPVPTVPVTPDVKPVAPPETKPATLPDLKPTLPTMVGGIPRLDFAKPPAATNPNIPAAAVVPPPPVPVTPAGPAVPAIPAVPVLPPPAPITPPPAAVKLPEPPQPVIPVPPVSSLPGGNGGTTVKPDNLGGGTVTVPPVIPVIPAPAGDPVKPAVPAIPAVPAVGTPGTPTGTPVELVKPPAPINPIVPTPGETMFHLNRAAALAVLGGAILAPSSPAAAPALPVPFPPVSPIRADEKTELADLKKQVEEANRKLTDIQRDIKQLTEAINGRKDEKGFPLTSDPGLVAQMKELTNKLSDIDKELNKLKTQTALRPANPIVTPDPKAGKGTVRVVNEYPVRISIVVNGTSYRVEPTKSLDIDIAAGEFTYQLLESGAASTRSVIKEKETVTLRIK